MTSVELPIIKGYKEMNNFIEWMQENIGEFDVEWKWVNGQSFDKSILVAGLEKATLVALRWK